MCANPTCVAVVTRLRRRVHKAGDLRLEDIGSAHDIGLNGTVFIYSLQPDARVMPCFFDACG